MKNQLKILIPTEIFTTTVGEITLKPFPFKLFPTVLDIISKYFELFVDKEPAQIISSLMAKSETDYAILLDINQLITISTNESLTQEQLGDLGYDEYFAILAEIIEQNRSFFTRLTSKINKTENEDQNSQAN